MIRPYPFLKNNIKITSKKNISYKDPCFIVAEISANHSGNLNILKKTMLKAKEIGADAVKIQTYQANTITLNANNKHFLINDKSIWRGKRLFDLYKNAETPFRWHKEIFKFAKKNKILCFSAPFDISAVNLLEKNNCPIYKVASPEIEDLFLIDKIAKTKKPIIISTGIADEKNIATALNICKKNKNFNVILLNCISSYPAKFDELNLNYINVLRKFCPLLGYSDHSTSDLASIISVSKGAKVIEKHFILSKKIRTPDSSFSYDPIEFKNLIKKIRDVEVMLGSESINKKLILKKKLKTVTRSIFYSKNINKGERITLENIKSVRPGTGLNLSYFTKIIGKKVKKNCKFGQPVKLKDITLN